MSIRIHDETFHDAESAQSALARAHGGKTRPLCLCQPNGVEMYVAKTPSGFIVKRMPNTGADHAPECAHFEPPPELSGLGQLKGGAIQEAPDEGVTTLKFDFALKRGGARPTPTQGETDKGSAAASGSKMSLRGLLHYLWDEAHLNRWTPAMEGKRTWGVVRRALLAAAADKIAKGSDLAGSLYIPEPYRSDHAAEIAQRRATQLARAVAPAKGPRPLMLAIGEVKDIAPARYGYKFVFRHSADFSFFFEADLHKRLSNKFGAELDLHKAVEDSHLVAIATFGVSATGVASVEEVALMVTTANWLPFDHMPEKALLDALTLAHRRFTKGLRYNLPKSAPLAAAFLTDAAPRPTALYVTPPAADDDYDAAMSALIAESASPSWLWRTHTEIMPALPAAHHGARG